MINTAEQQRCHGKNCSEEKIVGRSHSSVDTSTRIKDQVLTSEEGVAPCNKTTEN